MTTLSPPTRLADPPHGVKRQSTSSLMDAQAPQASKTCCKATEAGRDTREAIRRMAGAAHAVESAKPTAQASAEAHEAAAESSCAQTTWAGARIGEEAPAVTSAFQRLVNHPHNLYSLSLVPLDAQHAKVILATVLGFLSLVCLQICTCCLHDAPDCLATVTHHRAEELRRQQDPQLRRGLAKGQIVHKHLNHPNFVLQRRRGDLQNPVSRIEGRSVGIIHLDLRQVTQTSDLVA